VVKGDVKKTLSDRLKARRVFCPVCNQNISVQQGMKYFIIGTEACWEVLVMHLGCHEKVSEEEFDTLVQTLRYDMVLKNPENFPEHEC